VNGEAMTASQENVLVVEQFLAESYLFRRNILNGKVEFAKKSEEDGAEPAYRPLTQEALNSIILRAKREDICEGANPKTDIVEFIHSKEVRAYDRFNNEEVARIQQLNQGYMEQKDILEIIKVCFRKPEEGEIVKSMNASELLGIIQDKYPTVSDDLGTRVRLGKAMKLLEYDSTNRGHISYYKAVPLKVA
jgi:hypothetical protein